MYRNNGAFAIINLESRARGEGIEDDLDGSRRSAGTVKEKKDVIGKLKGVKFNLSYAYNREGVRGDCSLQQSEEHINT